ncbi:hypothetical protein LINGRAHAP2_LOCUS27557 [Linum grandiflorum]
MFGGVEKLSSSTGSNRPVCKHKESTLVNVSQQASIRVGGFTAAHFGSRTKRWTVVTLSGQMKLMDMGILQQLTPMPLSASSTSSSRVLRLTGTTLTSCTPHVADNIVRCGPMTGTTNTFGCQPHAGQGHPFHVKVLFELFLVHVNWEAILFLVEPDHLSD